MLTSKMNIVLKNLIVIRRAITEVYVWKKSVEFTCTAMYLKNKKEDVKALL